MCAVVYVLLALTFAGALAVAALWYAIVFPVQPFRGPIPPPTAEEKRLAAELEAHVQAIARTPRNLDHYAALEQAAATIERFVRSLGLYPEIQSFEVAGLTVRNIEVVIGPQRPTPHVSTYVLGAHYDSPDTSPGANDNASGVAMVLELTRAFAAAPLPGHRLRFVLFPNEEHPYGHTPDMGSWRHARYLAALGERVAGMISLETMGYFSDAPGSQSYPPPFGLIYPDTGNFVAFVGLPGSRRFLRRAVRAFRAVTPFPAIGGLAPEFVPGVALSDHWAYRRFGFPAVMLTDTAPYRNPYYHTEADLPHTVDYTSLARITLGVERMLRRLSE